MAHFPMYIDIRQKKCLVIGGGRVAARKVETLLKYEAHVVVISPEICEEILGLLPDSQNSIRRMDLMEVTEEELEAELSGSVLVVAASGSREANHRTAQICNVLHIPVNVVDAPEECSFLFPAVVKKGNISIGINTGGQSPIVSRRIREDVDTMIPDYYADIAEQLSDLRRLLKDRVMEEGVRRRALKEVAAAAFAEERPLAKEEIGSLLDSAGVKL